MSEAETPQSLTPANWLVSHSGHVLLAFGLLTAALVPAAIWLGSSEVASTEPGGEVFDLRDDLERKLTSPIFPAAYLVEARDGDVLTQRALWELLQAQGALLEADRRGELAPDGIESQPLLAGSFDPNTSVSFRGVVTMADAVDRMLRLHPALGTDLEHASDDQVKLAVSVLLLSPLTAELTDLLSVRAKRETRTVLGQEIDYWTSPALVFVVVADNAALGGGSAGSVSGLVGDDVTLVKERFSRRVQELLRGSETHYRLWGIAIDQNLEAEEEGNTAGVFIMLTVIAALGVVSLTLRSYWATALTAVGIGILMVWLKGITGLVGIKGGLIIEFIVPIAMVSLGVDFAVHAVRRYGEERFAGNAPTAALALGFGGVLGALVLAMVSDSIAFLSNVPSGIEAVVHFGLAAGIAVASAFVVLGLMVPLALMRIDRMRPVPGRGSPTQRILVLGAGAGVTVLCGVAVILIVAVSVPAGIALLAATAAGFLALPVALRARHGPGQRVQAGARAGGPSWVSSAISALVTGSARRPMLTLGLAAMVTTLSIVLALRLDASLDVKDFFAADADFVVSLDKVDEHIGERSGEGGTIYVRGDLTNPAALRAVASFMDALAENPYVGTELDGEPSIFSRNVVDIVRRLAANPGLVADQLGGPVLDADGDGLPDSQAQLRALLDYAAVSGVPLAEPGGELAYTAEAVGAVVYHNPFSADDDVAAIIVGIPGTRELTVVAEAKAALERDLVPLTQAPGISRAGLTGSPFTRNAEITATTRSLRTSLPIAAVGALLALAIAMRSVRYAIVTVIPIGLVVAWLYAIMFLAGFALNFVTATIGAVSIGVGIDYSIHMTMRFREELSRRGNSATALAHAASGTGTALLGSAGSSIVGFAIMGFAPMPMFSTYGILTATMIFLALAASLLVLPSLLILAAREGRP